MKTAFIGMDYIFDIVHPDGKLSRNSSQVLKRSVIAKVNRYPAKASAATRDAKCLGAGRERPQGLSRPFSSCRMWSVSAGF